MTLVIVELVSLSEILVKFRLVGAGFTRSSNYENTVQTQRNVLCQDQRDSAKGYGFSGSVMYIVTGKPLRVRQ